MIADGWWRKPEELDPAQRRVIGLPEDGSYLIVGPPGSGKTNLLLLRANYLTNRYHPNLAIIVFTRPLSEYIRSGAARYDFDAGNVYTSAAFFDRLLGEAGRSIVSTGRFEEDRTARIVQVEEVIARANRGPIYDILLVDEGQDMLPQELRFLRRLTHDFFVVADRRQQIYDIESPFDALEEITNESIVLQYHYRNGPVICAVADSVGNSFSIGYDPILPTCNYDATVSKSSADVFRGDFEAQSTEIVRRLQFQRRVYSDDLLGVVCPRVEDVTRLSKILLNGPLRDQLCIQSRETGYQAIDPAKPIWVSTIHGSKGLEFRALHFASAEAVRTFGPTQKRLAYTAITRCKTALSIYHHGHLPNYLDSAVSGYRTGHTVDPGIGAAFGVRR